MEVPANLSELSSLRQACSRVAGKRITNTENYMLLLLAVEEWFVNICSYAYPESEGKIIFEISLTNSGALRCTFKDCGIPFDPLSFDSAANSLNSAENLLIGGHGIQIICQATDSQEYKRENGWNCFTFEKSI